MLSHNYSLYIKRSVSARKHQRFSVNAESDIVAVATVTTVPKRIGTVGTDVTANVALIDSCRQVTTVPNGIGTAIYI